MIIDDGTMRRILLLRMKAGLIFCCILLLYVTLLVTTIVIAQVRNVTTRVHRLDKELDKYRGRVILADMMGEEVHQVAEVARLERLRRYKARIKPPWIFTMNNETLCGNGTEITYLIYIHSRPESSERRKKLRQTWARQDLFTGHNTRVVFVLGATTDIKLQSHVLREQELYADIIQTSVFDSPRNTTYKGVAALTWIDKYCRDVEFVIKAEDSVVINIFLLMELITTEYGDLTDSVLACMWLDDVPILHKGNPACRSWCVDPADLPDQTVYPRYCTGGAYVMSGKVVTRMARDMHRRKLFFNEDIYVTGILAMHVVLPRVTWIQEDVRFEMNLQKFWGHYKHEENVSLMVTRIDNEDMYLPTWELILKRITAKQAALMDKGTYSKLLRRT